MDGFWAKAIDALNFFAFVMVEMAVLFVGISVLVGLLMRWLPAERVQRFLSGRNGGGYLVASVLGGLTPFCTCSTIPLMVGLLRARAGFGPTMTFLFTSPLVNPVLVSLFVVVFGWRQALLYASFALVSAVVVGWLLQRFGFQRFLRDDVLAGDTPSSQRAESSQTACCEPTPAPLAPLTAHAAVCCSGGPVIEMRPLQVGACCGGSTVAVQAEAEHPFRRLLGEAVGQFRKFLPYLFLGVAVGSLAHGFVPHALVARYAGADNPFAIPVSAVIGIPLYVRASLLLPIAKSLVGMGMSMGAIVALVIGGAGASLPEIIMLKGLFRWPLMAAFVGVVLGMAIGAGVVFNLIHWERLA